MGGFDYLKGLEIPEKAKKNIIMVYKIGYIKDRIGNNYIAIKFHQGVIQPFLDELREIVDNDEEYETLVNNQQKRDNRGEHTHHVTILTVKELNDCLQKLGKEMPNRIKIIQSLDITDLTMEGVGKAERAGNVAYFIVVNSPTLDEVRTSLGLEPKDFHITIGFDRKDVFDVRKNKVIKKKD